MNSNCYKKLDDLFTRLDNERSMSYDDIDDIKSSGELEAVFASNKITEELYNATKAFFKILFNEYENYDDNFKSIKKIALETSDLNRTFRGTGAYMTCAFIDDIDSYRDFPAYLLSLMKKFNIKEYGNFTYKEMLNLIADNMDIVVTPYNLRYKRCLKDTYIKDIDYYGRYKKYNERVRNKKANIKDENDFSVFAELDTYREEKAMIEKTGFSPSLVRWTAVEFGDGYGYDVLSFDPVNMREKMIEVKSGISPDFILSRNEFKTAMKTLKQPNDEYYVHKYYRESNGSYNIKKLIFDKDELCFVNIANENDIYNYSPRWYRDENGKEIIEFVVMPQERYENFKNKRY